MRSVDTEDGVNVAFAGNWKLIAGPYYLAWGLIALGLAVDRSHLTPPFTPAEWQAIKAMCGTDRSSGSGDN